MVGARAREVNRPAARDAQRLTSYHRITIGIILTESRKGEPMELKGCAAIVTGGSGGLGQRICRALALAGVNVAVNYAESKAKAEGVAADLSRLGVRSLAIQADV